LYVQTLLAIRLGDGAHKNRVQAAI